MEKRDRPCECGGFRFGKAKYCYACSVKNRRLAYERAYFKKFGRKIDATKYEL